MRRLLAGVALALAVTAAAATVPVSDGGVFQPIFNYVVSGQWTWTNPSPFCFPSQTDIRYQQCWAMSNPTANGVLTFPARTDTVVTRNAPETLTNKTLDASLFTETNYIEMDDGGRIGNTQPNATLLITFNQADSVINIEGEVLSDTVIGAPSFDSQGAAGGLYETSWADLFRMGLVKGRNTPLTGGAATQVARFGLESGGGFAARLFISVFARDANDAQTRMSEVVVTGALATIAGGSTKVCKVYGTNDAATENPDETMDGSGGGAMTTGTLTYDYAMDTGTAATCILTLNAVSSLTEQVLEANVLMVAPYGGNGFPQPGS